MRRVSSISFIIMIMVTLLTQTAFAYDTMATKIYDDFERESLGVTAPGNTGAGTEPDDTWVHNPDGVVVYWIQYNPETTKPSVEGGALVVDATEGGWVGFGLVGDFADKNYDSVIVRMKGEQGGEESAVYFNVQGVIDLKWDTLRDPDGSPLPAITTEYQDFVFSLRESGMGATKAQRNILAKGFTDLHINTTAPAKIYIDSITLLQTVPYTEPVAPATAAPDATATPEPTPEATATVAEVSDRDLEKSFLVDDFNRASLMLDPEMEVAPGGAFGGANEDGNVIYWIQWNDNTAPIIEDGALHLTAKAGGWYGTASDMAFLDEYDCFAFRVKGANGGEEKLLTFNPDTLGAKPFTELKGPDGQPIPAITAEWQTIVVDLMKSGWKGLADGKEYYQNIHINTSGDVDLYIDEMYFLAVNPQPAPVSAPTAEPTAEPTSEPSATPEAAATIAPTAETTSAPTPTVSSGSPNLQYIFGGSVAVSSGNPKLPYIIGAGAVALPAICAIIIIIVTGKPKQK
ncbi:MAG: PT domain-containing protein [Oscillospiraceae bacterium]|jgi:hypothetical protein|nr:PT domain-containing protein [Oscillospiraceae bacterium]